MGDMLSELVEQAVLTVEYARICGLEILGILLNLPQKVPDTAESTNPDVIARLTGLPVHGPLDLFILERGTELPGSQAAAEAVRRACPELVEALVGAAGSAG